MHTKNVLQTVNIKQMVIVVFITYSSFLSYEFEIKRHESLP